ncbi:Transcription factor TRY-like protein [Drosera capensis]
MLSLKATVKKVSLQTQTQGFFLSENSLNVDSTLAVNNIKEFALHLVLCVWDTQRVDPELSPRLRKKGALCASLLCLALFGLLSQNHGQTLSKDGQDTNSLFRSIEWEFINMTEEEEDLIFRMYKLVGDRWALIAGRVPGRKAEEIERFWIMRHVPHHITGAYYVVVTSR